MTSPSSRAYDPPMRGSRGQKRWLTLTLLFTLVSGVAWAQRHERKRVERAEILAMEAEWRAAQLSEDIAAMDHLLSENFLGVTAAGQVVTKSQQLDRMRSRQMAITRLDMAETKIKISGNLAVVTSLARLDGTSNGAPLRGFFRYTRVYQRAPGESWKITNFEATRVPNEVGMQGAGLNSPQASVGTLPVGAPSSPAASRAESGSPKPQS